MNTIINFLTTGSGFGLWCYEPGEIDQAVSQMIQAHRIGYDLLVIVEGDDIGELLEQVSAPTLVVADEIAKRPHQIPRLEAAIGQDMLYPVVVCIKPVYERAVAAYAPEFYKQAEKISAEIS